jgi:hypothetical protein
MIISKNIHSLLRARLSLSAQTSQKKSNQLYPKLTRTVIRHNHVPPSTQLYYQSNHKNHLINHPKTRTRYHDVIMKANFSSSVVESHHGHDHDTTKDKQNPNIENPLTALKSISQKFHKCDEDGFRTKNCHWTFALSIVDSDDSKNIEMKKVSFIFVIMHCLF